MNNISDFELYDFLAEANFYQFVDPIRGRTEEQVVNFSPEDDPVNGCDLVHNFASNYNQPLNNCPNPEATFANSSNNVFGFDHARMVPANPMEHLFGGGSSSSNALADFDGEIGMGCDDDDEINGEDSSGTTTTAKRGKVDRSRTLISERRRRGRMKEKLYALRSLVPNITKMDKASIVGDAVLYVEGLQAQAKKLKSEIESLEASLAEAERYQLGSLAQSPNKTKAIKPIISVPKIIIQMDIFQVEERGFYAKVVCNNGEGAAVSMYKALESLTSFNVQTSNLATVSDRFVLTFTLNVKECEQDQINLPNLKLWVTGAFLNQGFQFS